VAQGGESGARRSKWRQKEVERHWKDLFFFQDLFREREYVHKLGEGTEGEGERQNPKQTPC